MELARITTRIGWIGITLGAGLAGCSSSSDTRTPTNPPQPPPPPPVMDASTNTPPDTGMVQVFDAGFEPDAAVCNPACTDRACGPDGCGGECGTCGDRELCDETSGMCVPQLCPPIEPFGINVGQSLPAITFTDCDGNSHSLHDLCDHKASYFFIFAGW